jgi:hypothetical protein
MSVAHGKGYSSEYVALKARPRQSPGPGNVVRVIHRGDCMRHYHLYQHRAAITIQLVLTDLRLL